MKRNFLMGNEALVENGLNSTLLARAVLRNPRFMFVVNYVRLIAFPIS